MKYKTTDREQRNGQWLVVGIGYCDAQYLLKYFEPVAYTCGVYGWRADFYQFGNVAISTGYGPLTYYSNKDARKLGEWLKPEILKLNERIRNDKIKTTGDYWKNQKKIARILDNLIKKGRRVCFSVEQ